MLNELTFRFKIYVPRYILNTLKYANIFTDFWVLHFIF